MDQTKLTAEVVEQLGIRKTKHGVAMDLRIYCEGPDAFRLCNVTPEARQERFLRRLTNHEARNVLYDLPAILNARRDGDST